AKSEARPMYFTRGNVTKSVVFLTHLRCLDSDWIICRIKEKRSAANKSPWTFIQARNDLLQIIFLRIAIIVNKGDIFTLGEPPACVLCEAGSNERFIEPAKPDRGCSSKLIQYNLCVIG